MELQEILAKEGYTDLRYIEGRGWCGLMRFVFTTGLCIGIDAYGYYGRYCYSDRLDALSNLHEWDGKEDPDGNWIKYKGQGGERSNIIKE